MNFSPNTIYHIYNQGNNQQKIFFSRENYLFLLKKMRKHILPYGDILCYCLMPPNHFHWMVYVKDVEIGVKDNEMKHQGVTLSHALNRAEDNENNDGMNPSHPIKLRSFNESIGILLRSYIRAINKQNNWSGSLFRSKTKAIPFIETELRSLVKGNLYQPHYAENCFHYIHENPVKARLVTKAEDWEFSSAPDYAQKRNGSLCNIELTKNLEIL